MPLFGRKRPPQVKKVEPARPVAAPADTPTPSAAKRALPVANGVPGGSLPPIAGAPPPGSLRPDAPTGPRSLPTVGGGTARVLPAAGSGAAGPRSLPLANSRPSATPLAADAPAESGGALSRPGTPFEEAVKRAVATVHDPEIGRPMVELGMIKDLVFEGQAVKITVELTTPACPLKERIEGDVRAAIATVPGVERVDVTLTSRVRATAAVPGRQGLPGVKNTVAIASGKGGVGKSTVATNLAVALALDGAKVGLLDADVYGPSMPLMLDLQGRQPRVRSIPSPIPGEKASQKLQPLDAHGIKVMSVGFLMDPEKPVIWRGPMASQLINQFITDVEWGELDYLLIDLPPGTGDIQLTLTQRLPLSGAVIVTTPQDVALADAVKGLQMFKEVQVPVLGIIENMSYFICPGCGDQHAIFGQGGGEWASKRYDVPLLGQIPLAPAIREGGDAGTPIVAADPLSPHAAAFRAAAQATAGRLSVEAVLSGGQRPSGPLIQIQRRKPV